MSADLTYTAGFSISRNFATFPSFWHSELKSSKAFGINLGRAEIDIDISHHRGGVGVTLYLRPQIVREK